MLKPMILYKITKLSSGQRDTTQTIFSEQNCDTLFDYSSKVFESIKLQNVDTIINGRTSNRESDPSGAWVRIIYSGQILSKRVSDLNLPDNSTREMRKLVSYLNKFQ
jgi:hypothetical protein